jgi:hypothetical protein
MTDEMPHGDLVVESASNRVGATVAPNPSLQTPADNPEKFESFDDVVGHDNPESQDDIIDRWFHGTFPGSMVAVSTEMWNFLHSAKEELKKMLSQ